MYQVNSFLKAAVHAVEYFGVMQPSPGGAQYAAEPSPVLSGGVNKEKKEPPPH